EAGARAATLRIKRPRCVAKALVRDSGHYDYPADPVSGAIASSNAVSQNHSGPRPLSRYAAIVIVQFRRISGWETRRPISGLRASGMDPILPTFLIVGAAKSGTSSLWHYLREHPDVYVPAGKEINFFSDEANFSRGLDWYTSHFKSGAGKKAIG